MATDIIRKHRLWETFLYQVLGLSMHEIHREAELLEHATSDFLLEKINQYLGNPTTDPHGDPIPNEKGMIETEKGCILLSATKVGVEYEICRLDGSDKEFYDFCLSSGMSMGATLIVKKQYPANKMIEIEINSVKLLLNSDLTGSIYVKPIKK